MLRLRKKQNPSPRTGCIHRGTNQGIAAHRKNDCVGATTLGEFADAVDDIRPGSVYGIVEPETCILF